MVVSTDSVVLLKLYRRTNKTCQETCEGKLLVSTGLKTAIDLSYNGVKSAYEMLHEI